MYHRQCIINSGAFRPRGLLFYKHAYLHIPLIMYFTCIIRGSSLIKLGALQDNRNYIAEILNFGDIMVLVWTPLPHPPLPHPPLPHPPLPHPPLPHPPLPHPPLPHPPLPHPPLPHPPLPHPPLPHPPLPHPKACVSRNCGTYQIHI